MAKIRKSNFELCRIVAILCVMLVHTTFQSLGHDVSFWVMLLAGFSIIGVNVFVMLIGFFTTTPKKTTLVKIAFVCFFWMIIKMVFHNGFGGNLGYKDAFFITSSNWFIPSYIGLIFLLQFLMCFVIL